MATTTTTTQVNGEKSPSATIDHIYSYPLVSDISQKYQENPLGAKSISIARSAYDTFAAPVLPYLQTPYSIVHPYIAKADSLGDSTLSHVDSHFPALKSTDLASLQHNVSDAAYFPFRVAGEGRDYVYNTYEDEYKKTGGEPGLVHTGKAVISTELRIASDALHGVADWLGPKKEAAEEELQKLKQTANEKMGQAKKTANEKKEQYVNSN